jgi:hypothetical protein
MMQQFHGSQVQQKQRERSAEEINMHPIHGPLIIKQLYSVEIKIHLYSYCDLGMAL